MKHYIFLFFISVLSLPFVNAQNVPNALSEGDIKKYLETSHLIVKEIASSVRVMMDNPPATEKGIEAEQRQIEAIPLKYGWKDYETYVNKTTIISEVFALVSYEKELALEKNDIRDTELKEQLTLITNKYGKNTVLNVRNHFEQIKLHIEKLSTASQVD